MARGWESKSVESQQEAAASNRERHVPPTPVELSIQGLQLSRKRLLHEIAASSSPRFQELKQRALLHLDREIARLRESQTQQ
jgi:hypothetical protein